ncbi:MAG TPA: class I SAM-dependent methyltransferase [Chitinophagaceae bacterium]|nr:class I SAM-dependent methyltransferase [Chitinophagaceae bacterium]
MNCKICTRPTSYFDEAVIMGKYKIWYYRCGSCGFIQTEDPYWLEESYNSAINITDTGILARNLRLSKITAGIISIFYKSDSEFLDYAGGYGIFTRMMRDLGYDFYWQDPYCKNLTARGFEIPDNKKVSLVTAFEVFEHLEEPIAEIEKMRVYSDSILFTTELYAQDRIPKTSEWWYYGLEHGQHVGIYCIESLKALAAKLNMNLYSDNRSIHLLTARKINPALFYLALKLSSRGLFDKWIKRETKTMTDMYDLKKTISQA